MHYAAAPDVVSTLRDDHAVLLNVTTGESYALDPVATRTWSLLTTVCSGDLDEVVARLQREYAAAGDAVGRDVRQLVQDLLSKELLSPTVRSPGGPGH